MLISTGFQLYRTFVYRISVVPHKFWAQGSAFGMWISLGFVFAQAVEEALRKDRDCPVEKEHRKGRGTSGREEAQPPPPDVEA